MDSYVKELAPWEKKREYYSCLQLGKDVNELKQMLKNQVKEMITNQITSASNVIVSKEIAKDVADDFAYKIDDIEQGYFGLKASFEWGISDIVWRIELDKIDLKEAMRIVYATLDMKQKELKNEAENAYISGKIDEANEYFLLLLKNTKTDFSAYISLGIIYLFHKINKEKALGFFKDAVDYSRFQSAYHTSYALLYMALIKRDFGLIEEAEKLSLQAMRLSPKFTEALYQNAQYNALLGVHDKAIPLLREVIKRDIVYCLKVNNEEDFNGIETQVNEMFGEIRDEKVKIADDKLKKMVEDVDSMDSIVKDVKLLGYDISGKLDLETRLEKNKELENMIKNNSIFDAHMANYLILKQDRVLQQRKNILSTACQEIMNKLVNKAKELSDSMLKEKKNSGMIRFFIYLLLGQIVIIPAGLAIGGAYGIYMIGETCLFALCVYLNAIAPRSKWKIINNVQREMGKMEKALSRIKNTGYKEHSYAN